MWQPGVALRSQPGGRVPAVGQSEAFPFLLPPLGTQREIDGAWSYPAAASQFAGSMIQSELVGSI